MEEKEEELERKLRTYISQHCEKLEYKIHGQGGKVIKIKWEGSLLNLTEVNGMNYNYEFRGDAQIFMEAGNNEDIREQYQKLHGEALIKENGDIEINRPIIIGI